MARWSAMVFVVEDLRFGLKVLVPCPVEHGHRDSGGNLEAVGRIGQIQQSAGVFFAPFLECVNIVFKPLGNPVRGHLVGTAKECAASRDIPFRYPFTGRIVPFCFEQVVDDKQRKNNRKDAGRDRSGTRSWPCPEIPRMSSPQTDRVYRSAPWSYRQPALRQTSSGSSAAKSEKNMRSTESVIVSP